MSDGENKKLNELLKIVKNSAAMNGGFDRLADSVEKIQECNIKVLLELDLVKSKQDTQTEKIDELYQALYEPDDGLYRRVIVSLDVNEQQTKEINKIKIKTANMDKELGEVQTATKTIEAIAGQDFEGIRSVVVTQKKFAKATWAFSLAAVIGLAKFIWDVIPGLL